MNNQANIVKGRQGFQRTHGLRKTPEYAIWNGVKQRCYNPNVDNYPRYGGAGIAMCDEWRDDFSAFYRDMGPRPSSQHSIERRDNAKGYGPSNCYWATLDEQANNKRRTIRIKGKTVAEIADETGLDKKTIRGRFYQGNTDRILSSEPLRRRDAETMNKGSSNGQAKLSEADVVAIRAARAGGMKMRDIAAQYGVSAALISAICAGKRWGWF